MKLLIDECLSAELARLAVERGHVGSSHVRWIGKAGMKDWNLLPIILSGDWTFVTRNAYDFRGPAHAPGSKGEYAKTTLHPGLICLNGPTDGFDLDTHVGETLERVNVLDFNRHNYGLVRQYVEAKERKGGDDQDF